MTFEERSEGSKRVNHASIFWGKTQQTKRGTQGLDRSVPESVIA